MRNCVLTWFYRNSKAANWSPSKVRFIDNTRRSRDQPGPGAYNPSDVDSTAGSYIVSNFRNTGHVKFIKPKINTGMRSRTPLMTRGSKFFHSTHSIDQNLDLNQSEFCGEACWFCIYYLWSRIKFKSSDIRIYKLIYRKSSGVTASVYGYLVTPGPGSYMLPSDFGYLENKGSPRNMMST